MAAPTKRFEELVYSGKLRHNGHRLLRWNVDCVTVASDAFGVASKAWNDLCADYQAGLTAFHGKVSSTNMDMKMTDQELAKMFDF